MTDSAPGAAKRRDPLPRFRFRWGIVGMLFASNAIVFLDRTNISIALPQMSKEMHIEPFVAGLLLSSFFWMYALFQLPGGALADKVRSKVLLAGATVFWGIATVLTGLVSSIGLLFGFRFALGVGESITAPTYSKVTSAWFSAKERSVATAIWDSGNRFGTAAALPALTAITYAWGWQWAFFISGAIAIVWVPIWWLFYNFAVKRNERDLGAVPREAGARDEEETEQVKVSWGTLLTLRPMWGLMVGYFCLLFVNYFFITWFPAYLIGERHFTPAMLGLMGAIPPICAVISNWMGGLTSAYLLKRGRSLTFARKLPIIVGLLVASSIAFVPFVQGDWGVIVMLSIAYSGVTFATPSVWCLPAEMAPTPSRVGSISGLQNFAGNLAGITGPIIIGAIYGLTGSFAEPLILAGAVVLVGVVVYILLLGPVQRMRLRGEAAVGEIAAFESVEEGR